MGLSLTIPLAIASDLCRGKPVVMQQYLAAFFVCAGFLILSTTEDDADDKIDLNNVDDEDVFASGSASSEMPNVSEEPLVGSNRA